MNNAAFELVPALNQKPVLIDLDLSRVLMETKKDFPWVLLVPRVANVSQINQLSVIDQQRLWKEVDFISNIMEKIFPCDRLNVAAIGNMTPQLHIHIICRRKDDPLFPDVVWNKEMLEMTETEILIRSQQIKAALASQALSF